MPIEATSNQAAVLGLEGVTGSNSSQTTQDRVGQKALGQDDFFKLLTTQLAAQDPLQPMEDTAFIAQMASFSELEMTSALTKSFDKFTSSQSFASAHGYIGKTVTLSTGEVGKVTSVEFQDDQALVFLNGKNTDGRDINTISKVEAGDTSSEGGAMTSAVEGISQNVRQIMNALTGGGASEETGAEPNPPSDPQD